MTMHIQYLVCSGLEKEGRDNIFRHNLGYIQTIAKNEVLKHVTFHSSNLELEHFLIGQ